MRCGAFARGPGTAARRTGSRRHSREYQRAVDLDPGFARAYSGMAGVYVNYFRQPEKAAASYKAAMKHLDRMTEREKYRTLGTYYLDIVRNYEKAIENFETLVQALSRRRQRPRQPGARLPAHRQTSRAR